jgi:hypothetical protein
VIAGGLALGLVASRLLKASSSDRYRQRTSGHLPERTPYRPSEAPDLGPTTGPVAHGSVVPATPAVPATFDASP